MSWFSRLINAVNPRLLDGDLAEEMRDHLERRTVALTEKGRLDREEARRQAQVRFGNVTRFQEQSRDFRLWGGIESALQDVRYAWRGMRKQPAFVATAVLSLALAIGANTAVYSLVDAAILRPLPVSKPDELFRLSWPDVHDPGAPAGDERETFSYPEYLQYVAASKPVARLGLFSLPGLVEAQGVNPDGAIEKINRAFVSGEAFDLLGVTPAAGRLFTSEEDRLPARRAVCVLSFDYWQRRFQADPAVVGRNYVLGGKPYEIAGVTRKGFFGVDPGKFVDVWLPGTLYEPAMALHESGWHWFRILGRLQPGTSPQQLEARLQPPFHDFQVDRMKHFLAMPEAIRKQFLESVIRVHSAESGVSEFRKTFSRPLWIVFGVAIVILMIACANVASLLLARSTTRATEMAMRISLGARRTRLVRQMLTESLLLSLMAGGLGWVLARVVAPLLVVLLSKEADPVRFALAIDTRVLFFCIGVSTLSAVLFGLVPAWQASRVQPMLSLRSSAGQAAKLRLGKLFVSIQVACAFCLVMIGVAFLLSLSNLFHVDPGFDARNVAVLDLTTDSQKSDDPIAWTQAHPDEEVRLRNLMFQLRARIVSQPGIQGAALAMWPILAGGGWSQQVIIPANKPSDREEIFYRVSPGYFSTLRTPLTAGRDFAPTDNNERAVMSDQVVTPAIVNEAFARRYFHTLDVLGREFSYPFGKSFRRETIVGLASDARYNDLRTSADPIVYLPTEGDNGFTVYVRSPLPLGQVVHIVDREAKAAGSGMRIRDITTLETIVGNTLTREKLLATVGGAFAFLGLLLAAIGLFGLLNYSVGRRTKEIGIRAALGARRAEIISLVLQDASGSMTGGLVIGLAAALGIMTIFRSLLFGIRMVDPLVIASAGVLFLATGLLAATLPAHRAATVDPMSALREE